MEQPCPSCGAAVVHPEAKFCPTCGSTISLAPKKSKHPLSRAAILLFIIATLTILSRHTDELLWSLAALYCLRILSSSAFTFSAILVRVPILAINLGLGPTLTQFNVGPILIRIRAIPLRVRVKLDDIAAHKLKSPWAVPPSGKRPFPHSPIHPQLIAANLGRLFITLTPALFLLGAPQALKLTLQAPLEFVLGVLHPHTVALPDVQWFLQFVHDHHFWTVIGAASAIITGLHLLPLPNVTALGQIISETILWITDRARNSHTAQLLKWPSLVISLAAGAIWLKAILAAAF